MCPARLVVSVHDVAPATAEQTARWCADADALGIPLSMLVVPGPWRGMALADAPDYARVLRDRRDGGDEIVLHGWEHVAPVGGPAVRRAVASAVARGAAEFAALDESAAARRIASGQAVMAQAGLSTTGFTPPGWLASPGALRALTRAGFTHTTSHFGVIELRTGQRHRGFAFSHRPTGGVGERIGVAMLERFTRRVVARNGLVRIALHPDDLRRPALREITVRAIERALAVGAVATTYAGIVAA